MTEAHELRLPRLHLADELRNPRGRRDRAQHPEHCLVGAAVERAVERGRRGGQRRVRIHLGRADRAHGVGRAVLLVVGVQDEEDVERALDRRIGLVLQLGGLEEHVQEVPDVREIVVGVRVRLTEDVAVRERGDRWHLCDQPVDLQIAVAGVVVHFCVGVEGRECGDGRDEHAHRVRVVVKAVHELLDVLVDPRVVGDLPCPLVERLLGRELTADQEVRDLEERRPLGELLDRVAAVPEESLLTVDEGDRAPRGRRVDEGRVVREESEVVPCGLDRAQVHRPDRAVCDRHLVGLAGPVVADRQGVLGAHDSLLASTRRMRTRPSEASIDQDRRRRVL